MCVFLSRVGSRLMRPSHSLQDVQIMKTKTCSKEQPHTMVANKHRDDREQRR